MAPPIRILHVSPSYYGDESVVGGGEKYVVYCDEAVRCAAEQRGLAIESTALSFGAEEGRHVTSTGFAFELMRGKPWQASTVDAADLQDRLREATVVHVHQCLSGIGLFVAAHARLLGKTVIGTDHGGGEHRLVSSTPELGHIFDWLHADSDFTSRSYAGLDGEVRVIRGPVDTDRYPPRDPDEAVRTSALTIGRIMAHKGFDRIVSSLPADLSLTVVGRPVDAEYASHLQRLGRNRTISMRTDVSDDELVTLIRRAGVAVFASTHRDYRGRYYAKPELLGLAPLECLSTGVPTFVSDAGALPELAALPGCHLFRSDTELRRLLEAHRDGVLPVHDPKEMHDAVAARYGFVAFGLAYFDSLTVESR